MFNRKFVTETKLVNTKKQSPTSITVSQAQNVPNPLIEKFEKISKQDLRDATVAAVGVYLLVKAANTLSIIAINYAPKHY
jgi:hypothetical protein